MPRHKHSEKLEHRLWRLYDSQARRFTIRLQPPDYSYLKDRFTYTYSFQPALPQSDPVIQQIRTVIREMNEHPEYGLVMCNNNIRVKPSTSAPPIWPRNANDDNDVKFYTFFQDDEEFPATAPVSVIPRTGKLTINKIHVRENGRWIPIREWLLQLADHDLPRRRGAQTATSLWSKRSKKTFRLMDLPIELRRIIFEYAIAPTDEVYPLSKVWEKSWSANTTLEECANAHITLGIGYMREEVQRGVEWPRMWGRSTSPLEYHEKVPPPPLALLRVSKQVKDEVLKAGWEGPKRCFIDQQDFTAVADSMVGAAAHFNFLGRIQLSFANKAWFKFFGVKVEPRLRQTEAESLAPYLVRLDSLAYFEIRFRHPNDGYLGDPWGERELVTSCQTVMIDWIMTFAFASIKHIAKINLTGYIKKPQKEKWHEIFRKQRRLENFEFDHQAAVKAILATPPRSTVSTQACGCTQELTVFAGRLTVSAANHAAATIRIVGLRDIMSYSAVTHALISRTPRRVEYQTSYILLWRILSHT